MATTVRTIDLSKGGRITLIGHNGENAMAYLTVKGHSTSANTKLVRSEVQQLISALLDVMATLSSDEPEPVEKLTYPVPANSEMLSGPIDQIDLLAALEASIEAAKAARNADREGQS